MKPQAFGSNVRAMCPDCEGAVTTFEYRDSSREFGYVVLNRQHLFQKKPYLRIVYRLLRCAGCGRGGLAEFHDNGQEGDHVFGNFFPYTPDFAPLPKSVPAGIAQEFREAELCASISAWRGASALIRSVLDKALADSGYAEGKLYTRIEQLAADGFITLPRKAKAHGEIRLLANDVLHEEWREVTEDEFNSARHYAQRILEDLYDDRPLIRQQLIEKKKIPA